MENVLVAFGGNSFEHDISVVTASQIVLRTKIDDVKIIPLYFSRENKMFVYENSKFDVSDFSRDNFHQNSKKFREVVFVSGENGKLFVKSKWGLKEYISAKVVICAFHGSNGENGKFEVMFENFGFLCSAGNVDSLSICMNKFLFKQVMKGLKIPVVSGFLLTGEMLDKNKKEIDRKLAKMKFPIILKSNNGGSSIGVFVAKNYDEFYDKLEDAFEFDSEVLIEKYVPNCREFNIAILGDRNDYIVSEIDEPLKGNELYSFADKYISKNKGKNKNAALFQNKKTEVDISSDVKNNIIKFAKKLFVNLNLKGVVRIDFLFDETNNKLFVCEVNSIPGSLAFYFFSKGRYIINDFVSTLIDIAKRSENDMFLIKPELVTNILN